MPAITMIGFGEAAQAFVAGWRSEANLPALGPLSAFDIKVGHPDQKSLLVEACRMLDVKCAKTPQEAVEASDIVFSLVTADRAFEAAALVAELIGKGAIYFDCNSCSPAIKVAAANLIGAAGAIYVDVAVMSPVYPKRHKSPLLISGAAAERASHILTALGMQPRVAGNTVGRASSIKMLRSVVIKGFEALTAECMLAARQAGVEEDVLASLQASDPGIDWTARSAYNLERMMVHGIRRSAEMEEVAATLRELGLPNRMALATVEWQREIGALDLGDTEASLKVRADAILDRLR
jgi:3-hydroxyisobutyrate dehydrogenase-like beta-hydroxyacid dehydrogenase